MNACRPCLYELAASETISFASVNEKPPKNIGPISAIPLTSKVSACSANFIEDFKNQNRIILGGVRRGTNKLRQVYSKVFPRTTIVKTGAKHAEMVKYFTNCFLATKVSFANEMKMLCDELDLDYDKVVEYATYDERLGKTHWAVPGPDGELGFGGHCLPKDLNALISVAVDNSLGLYINVLSGVLETNDKVRKERDWEQMKGRAVIHE